MFDASLHHFMCGVHDTTSCADLAINHGGTSNVIYIHTLAFGLMPPQSHWEQTGEGEWDNSSKRNPAIR